MKEYVKIEKSALERLYRRSKKKDAYIKKLRMALDSVKRQVANIKELNNEQT